MMVMVVRIAMMVMMVPCESKTNGKEGWKDINVGNGHFADFSQGCAHYWMLKKSLERTPSKYVCTIKNVLFKNESQNGSISSVPCECKTNGGKVWKDINVGNRYFADFSQECTLIGCRRSGWSARQVTMSAQ